MNCRYWTLVAASVLLVTIEACSKKTQPTTETTAAPETTAPVKKPVAKKVTPKVITVNDKAAKRSVDGRYYYDLEGRRYWRNNKDGKYYLFNKSMYNDPNFKPIPQ